MTRRADVKRQTAETSILVSMDLDGTGKADIRTVSDSSTTCCTRLHATAKSI